MPMNLRRRATGLASILVAIYCLSAMPATAATKIHEAEYGIISAVINHGTGGSGNIVIDATTTGEAVNISDPNKNPDELAQELGTTVLALREWSRLNKRRYILQENFSIDATHYLLEEHERLALFSTEEPIVNWHQFFAKFPEASGIVRVSRPGIDDAAKAAVLYLEFECGAQCGSGRLVNLIQSSDGLWRVTTGELIWITSP